MVKSVGYLAIALSATLSLALAQAPPDEHSQHHEETKATAPVPEGMAEGGSPASPGAAGTPGSGMGQMMQRMGAPAPKELYPSLMEFPDLPAEKRGELERQAHDRMTEGVKLMGEGLRKMNEAAPHEDYASMQDASLLLRQGLAQFDSGLAAHRALAEGKSPRNVALEWFNREMNLVPATEIQAPHGFFGLSWFHYFVMFILLAFTGTMILMYYHKMRRADALLVSLAAGKQEVTPATPSRAAAAPAHTMAPTPATAAPEGITPVITLPAGRWSGQLRVSKIFQETPDVRTFRLVHPSGGDLPFTFEPGQFLTVSVNIAGKELKRSYSIASSPCRRTLCEITVKQSSAGQVSGYLHEQMRAGDLLAVSGPFGKFTFRGHEADSVVLIAGGVGITPLMSAVRCLADQAWTGEIFLIYSCSTIRDIIFREELQYLERRYANFRLVVTLTKEPSPEWTGARGHITKESLFETVPNLSARRIHVCGPPAMMEAVKAILAEIGVDPGQVKTENFLGAEPRPSPPGGTPGAAEAAQVAAAICRFVRSGKSAPLPADRTVLDASEDAGVNIEYSCRQGYCGVCKTKLLAGHVTMAVEDGLAPEEKAADLILACQAHSDGNIEVDA
jgi:ferredoxin-NADP reductase